MNDVQIWILALALTFVVLVIAIFVTKTMCKAIKELRAETNSNCPLPSNVIYETEKGDGYERISIRRNDNPEQTTEHNNATETTTEVNGMTEPMKFELPEEYQEVIRRYEEEKKEAAALAEHERLAKIIAARNAPPAKRDDCPEEYKKIIADYEAQKKQNEMIAAQEKLEAARIAKANEPTSAEKAKILNERKEAEENAKAVDMLNRIRRLLRKEKVTPIVTKVETTLNDSLDAEEKAKAKEEQEKLYGIICKEFSPKSEEAEPEVEPGQKEE